MANGEKLGNRLYELRKKSGLSQEELSEKLNVSRQAVSKWECGESLPDTDNLITIAKLYGVSIDELIDNATVAPTPTSKKERGKFINALKAFPYPILVVVVFLFWGFLANGWSVAWTLFLTVPLYYTTITCIKRKRFTPFAYPVLIGFVYLLMGMQWGLWHPWWIIFITIPLYYAVAAALDEKK